MRLNDIIEFSNNNASHKAKVTAITDNYNFNITRLGSTTLANGAVTSPLVRTRPEIKDTNNRVLLTDIGQQAIKNTNKDNNTVAIHLDSLDKVILVLVFLLDLSV